MTPTKFVATRNYVMEASENGKVVLGCYGANGPEIAQLVANLLNDHETHMKPDEGEPVDTIPDEADWNLEDRVTIPTDQLTDY